MIINTKDEDKRINAFVGCVIGHMIELHVCNEDMALLLGIDVRTWERKIKDPYRFKLGEIVKISKKLKFDDHDVWKCFCFLSKGA